MESQEQFQYYGTKRYSPEQELMIRNIQLAVVEQDRRWLESDSDHLLSFKGHCYFLNLNVSRTRQRLRILMNQDINTRKTFLERAKQMNISNKIGNQR